MVVSLNARFNRIEVSKTISCHLTYHGVLRLNESFLHRGFGIECVLRGPCSAAWETQSYQEPFRRWRAIRQLRPDLLCVEYAGTFQACPILKALEDLIGRFPPFVPVLARELMWYKCIAGGRRRQM